MRGIIFFNFISSLLGTSFVTFSTFYCQAFYFPFRLTEAMCMQVNRLCSTACIEQRCSVTLLPDLTTCTIKYMLLLCHKMYINVDLATVRTLEVRTLILMVMLQHLHLHNFHVQLIFVFYFHIVISRNMH